MTILAVILQILAFYMLYNTSHRVEVSKDPLSLILQRHNRLATIGGVLLLISSFALFTVTQGLGSGIFAGFLSLMTMGSLVILFVPLLIKKS